MIRGKKVVVAMPAYNAEKTLERTFLEIPENIVDLVILVDDASQDQTVKRAKSLGIQIVIQHERNRGYGGNQKTCYEEALRNNADIIIILHPDYQYTPALIEPLASPIAHGVSDVVLGSRFLENDTLKGGMPFHKYCVNRVLTTIENFLLGQRLSEYHTGYRAYSREVLETIPFRNNADDFVFDNEILAQIFYAGFRVEEISCPTKYFPEASSINFSDSIRYSFGVLRVAIEYRLHCWRLLKFNILEGITKGLHGLKIPNQKSIF